MTETAEAFRFPDAWLDQLRARVSIVALIGEVTPLKRAGGTWSGRCPFHAEKTASFHVWTGHDAHFHCYGCGAHGDAIGFVMQLHRIEFRDAVPVLAARVSLDLPAGAPVPARREKPRPLPPPPSVPETSADEARRGAFIAGLWRATWRASWSGGGTEVEAWLRRRAIDVDAIGGVPPTLKFHPDLEIEKDGARYRAMVAAVQGPDRALCGIHRTFFKPPGTERPDKAVAKKMLGNCWGGAVRLAPLLDPAGQPLRPAPCGGASLAVSEGIETGAWVLGAYRRAGSPLPVWAALSMGNIAGAGDERMQRRAPPHSFKRRVDREGVDRGPVILPTEYPDMERPGIILPPEVRELIILADGDSDPEITRALMARAARRFQADRVTVRLAWPPAGTDWNSLGMALASLKELVPA
jgi:hypothetical protein